MNKTTYSVLELHETALLVCFTSAACCKSTSSSSYIINMVSSMIQSRLCNLTTVQTTRGGQGRKHALSGISRQPLVVRNAFSFSSVFKQANKTVTPASATVRMCYQVYTCQHGGTPCSHTHERFAGSINTPGCREQRPPSQKGRGVCSHAGSINSGVGHGADQFSSPAKCCNGKLP